MKLIDYGVREDEMQYIKDWSKENDIEDLAVYLYIFHGKLLC